VSAFDPKTVNDYLLSYAAADATSEDAGSLPHDLFCKFAGFGGQGILTLGLFLSQVAMRAGYQVTWIPSYGPEMRGGTANCQVNISRGRIGTPLVDNPNLLVVMNQPSLDAFEKTVVDGGTILVDTSIVEGRPDGERLHTVLLPASEMADEVGTPKVANVVMLGAMCASTDAFPPAFVEQSLHDIVKKKTLLEMNLQAFQKGYTYVKEGASD
jgi:Pyruvate/2-oxoacid:ferredoxin oxidoreductase gamma subunit